MQRVIRVVFRHDWRGDAVGWRFISTKKPQKGRRTDDQKSKKNCFGLCLQNMEVVRHGCCDCGKNCTRFGFSVYRCTRAGSICVRAAFVRALFGRCSGIWFDVISAPIYINKIFFVQKVYSFLCSIYCVFYYNIEFENLLQEEILGLY